MTNLCRITVAVCETVGVATVAGLESGTVEMVGTTRPLPVVLAFFEVTVLIESLLLFVLVVDRSLPGLVVWWNRLLVRLTKTGLDVFDLVTGFPDLMGSTSTVQKTLLGYLPVEPLLRLRMRAVGPEGGKENPAGTTVDVTVGRVTVEVPPARVVVIVVR